MLEEINSSKYILLILKNYSSQFNVELGNYFRSRETLLLVEKDEYHWG